MMPNGLQATCQGLWVADQATDNLYLLDDDLRPLREVPTVAENSSGLTIGGGFFWIGSNSPAQARYSRPTDYGSPSILKCDFETGELVERYPTPDGGGIHGLEWVEGLLWITSFRPKALRLIDPDGFKVVRTIQIPHERLHGLAMDSDGLWLAHTTDKIIVRYDTGTGEELERIVYPTDAPAPHGLTMWRGELWSCDANWPAPVHPDGPSYSRIVR